jgi:hypothetical protein
MTCTTTTHAIQTRALNQLASLLGGRDMALATNDFDHDPIARIEALITMASDEMRKAAAAGDQTTLKGAARKMESLGNLQILAKGLVEAA